MTVLHAFTAEYGDRERPAESIADFKALCAAKGLGLGLGMMGCKTFFQMTQPPETYVARAIAATLAQAQIAPAAVGHVVFSTMDKNLHRIDQDFARTVLQRAELTACVPVFLSMQQCASSLAAVDHARHLLEDPRAEHALVVAFDYVVDDADRIQPFALFGDAVACCLVSRARTGVGPALALRSYGVGVDFAGLTGVDNFESRKQVVTTTLGHALATAEARIDQIEVAFSTNFFKPIAWFNAGVCGIHKSRLALDTLAAYAHCGNCDWLMNITHRHAAAPPPPGHKFLAQAFAPGFFACAVLEAL